MVATPDLRLFESQCRCGANVVTNLRTMFFPPVRHCDWCDKAILLSYVCWGTPRFSMERWVTAAPLPPPPPHSLPLAQPPVSHRMYATTQSLAKGSHAPGDNANSR